MAFDSGQIWVSPGWQEIVLDLGARRMCCHPLVGVLARMQTGQDVQASYRIHPGFTIFIRIHSVDEVF